MQRLTIKPGKLGQNGRMCSRYAVAIRAKWALWLIVAVGLLVAAAPAGLVWAGPLPKAAADQKLQDLFRRLKSLDGYTYTVNSQSSIAGDTQKSPVQATINYSAPSAFLMYSSSDRELTFLCPKGRFRIDHQSKRVYYTLFESDSVLRQQKEYFSGQLSTVFDSLFLKQALIAKKKSSRGQHTYILTYPEGQPVREFRITAGADGVPQMVYYSIDHLVNSAVQDIKIRQHLSMTNYKHAMPDPMRGLVSNAGALLPYLEKQYPGYTFHKI